MIHQLAKPIRQALALALLVAAVAAFAGGVIVPASARLSELQDRIEQERTLLGRLSAIAGDEGLARDLDRRTAHAKARGLFLAGESEAIRLANLQSQLTEIASASGIKLRSARNMPARERNELRLLGVQLHLVAPIEQLRKMLVTIEERRPLLLIDALHITPLTSAATADGEQRGMLNARFDVYGVESRKKGG